jgi:hypothetical protein
MVMMSANEMTRKYMIDPRGIGFFKAILESYEDVAIMTVLDGKQGRIEIIYPSGSEMILNEIIYDMKRYNIHFRQADDV